MQDLRDDHYSVDGMREFFGDMIADLNEMHYVMTVNQYLLNSRRWPGGLRCPHMSIWMP
jgi:hypothetical protein